MENGSQNPCYSSDLTTCFLGAPFRVQKVAAVMYLPHPTPKGGAQKAPTAP